MGTICFYVLNYRSMWNVHDFIEIVISFPGSQLLKMFTTDQCLLQRAVMVEYIGFLLIYFSHYIGNISVHKCHDQTNFYFGLLFLKEFSDI